MDTYFRGNSQELEFCNKISAGGNHVVVTTADGVVLGKGRNLRLRERELAPVLKEYQSLPLKNRKATLPDPRLAKPPRRPVPDAPEGGLVIRGYCIYLREDSNGKIHRKKEFYYKENPDRWAAETQSDLLWLTKKERDSLLPKDAKKGEHLEVAAPIQKRFFSTIGIDYMEGSVHSLTPRKTSMTLTVTEVTPKEMKMRLDGYGHLGKALDATSKEKPNSRGSEIRVLGYLRYDRSKDRFTRFDVVGIGKAWGKLGYGRREVRIADHPWTYGIACELVTGNSPEDRIPPYNLLHYGSAGPYFEKK